MFVYIQSIVIVYQMASLSPQQCIRVLILLHGVGSEILSCWMYVPVYVFGIVSTVFCSVFLLCVCFPHTVVNKGIYYYTYPNMRDAY